MSTTSTPKQAAARHFLTEMRTRSSTQALPYQYGVEARALESMWEVFGQARDAIKNNHGCDEFAKIAVVVPNQVIRPFTAKWHKLSLAGAFNAASDLKTDRDKALKALSPSLVWWYQHSADPTLNALQRDKAREALTAFDEQITKVQASPDTRDFLAEMRARIGLKVASEEQGDAKRATFVDTLNSYSEIFTPEDLDALAQGNLKPESYAVTATERRRLRALAVIAKAKPMAGSDSLASLTASDLKNPQFAKLVFES